MRVIQEISKIQDINNWFIVDMGYSNSRESCGVLIVRDNKYTDEDLKDIAFVELEEKFRDFYKECKNEDIGLILEAPLSISFDSNRNPYGREFEKEYGEEKTKKGNKKITAIRYWYSGAGATVTLGALEFINRIKKILVCNNIYLFEGFVSFKKEGKKKGNDYEDAKLLYEGMQYIKDNPKYIKNIISDDSVRYRFIGDYLNLKINGIPPIVKISKENKKEIFMIKS